MFSNVIEYEEGYDGVFGVVKVDDVGVVVEYLGGLLFDGFFNGEVGIVDGLTFCILGFSISFSLVFLFDGFNGEVCIGDGLTFFILSFLFLFFLLVFLVDEEVIFVMIDCLRVYFG